MAMCEFLFGLLLLLLSSVCSDSSDPADQYIYGGCSSVKYTGDASYATSLDNMLTSIANSATFQAYNNFTIGSSNPQQVIYGLYQCRGDISMPDCAICVQQAVSQFHLICHQNCGGVIQLEGCFVKYDNATFIARQDKDIVLRKCGPSPDDYTSDQREQRDGVLAGLLNSGQPYRASGAEDIQSVAQCIGDLSPSQCQDCVTEAIQKVKQECFMASYGDMFLGKCYVRYTINRAHAPPSKGHSSMFSSNEKTFAIVAGLLAAMVLLIIFLMFLKNIFTGRNGK
ncbi:unnamed protein product [Rhodiola kirilowii]